MSGGSFEKSRLELVGTLQGHSRYVMSVPFSPDGTKIASGSVDKTVKLWDVTSGECLQTLEGHSNWVFSLSFSPDGTKLASGSSDQMVTLWEDPRVQERRREIKTMMFSLRRANHNKRDPHHGDPLPSEAGRKLYYIPGIARKIFEFL